MKTIIALFLITCSVSAFSQTASQIRNLGANCTGAQKIQMQKARSELKLIVQAKIEASEEVNCIGYLNDETSLSCGQYHGALATLKVKIKYSIRNCDASTAKVESYKISYID